MIEESAKPFPYDFRIQLTCEWRKPHPGVCWAFGERVRRSFEATRMVPEFGLPASRGVL